MAGLRKDAVAVDGALEVIGVIPLGRVPVDGHPSDDDHAEAQKESAQRQQESGKPAEARGVPESLTRPVYVRKFCFYR